MTQEEVTILLGRPLTTNESANFDLYLELAQAQLSDMLCYQLSVSGSSPVQYNTREGYQTVFTAPFTSVTTITRNGETVDPSKYTVKQNDSFYGTWFNAIVFDDKFCDEVVTITAVWGFADAKLPIDLQLVLANMFAVHSLNLAPKNIKSKRVEDFSITYGDTTPEQDFLRTYASLIHKYSICNQLNVQHGRTYYGRIPSFY